MRTLIRFLLRYILLPTMAIFFGRFIVALLGAIGIHPDVWVLERVMGTPADQWIEVAQWLLAVAIGTAIYGAGFWYVNRLNRPLREKEFEKPLIDVGIRKEERRTIAREDLANHATEMLAKSKMFYHHYRVSSDENKNVLFAEWREARDKFSIAAEKFLGDERVYSAAQDVINRCGILISDVKDGVALHSAMTEAHQTTRELLGVLSNDKP